MNVKKVGAGVGIAALLLAATACAAPGNAEETPAGVNASALPAPDERAKTEGFELYTDLATTIYGSGLDRWNAGRVLAYKMQVNFADCMREQGFEHTIQPYSTGGAGQISPRDGYDEFVELAGDFGIAFVAEQTAELSAGYTNPGFDKLDADGQKRWADAVNGACASVDPPGLENTHRPASLQGVSEAFVNEVLTPVHDDPVVAKMREDYAGCVAERGYDAASWSELRDATQALFPAMTASGPAPIDVDSDTWAATVQAEKDAAAADTACRSDMTAYAAGLAHPALLQFHTNHADQLAKISEEWAAMRAEAATLLK